MGVLKKLEFDWIERQTLAENLKIRGKHNCFPRDQSYYCICHIAGNYEAGNSLNLAVTAVVGQHSWVAGHCSEILAGNSFIVRCHVTSR